MSIESTQSRAFHGTARTVVRSEIDVLRNIAAAAGMCWAALFVVVGLRYELQLYGDGAMFSYSIAAQDAWAFHWHNIAGRLTVYLYSLLPSETYVAMSGDAAGGIVVYGLLFFAAQILGLAATYAADRSRGRIMFVYASASTASLCPLVFGFPTEMWVAHALFWPTLALAHYARFGIGGALGVFGAMVALVLTHEGALILAAVIVATLLPLGMRDRAFLRASAGFVLAVAVWLAVKTELPPGDYFAAVLVRAALDFFDPDIFTCDLVLLMGGTLVLYGAAFLVFARFVPARGHVYAAALTAVALAVYWTKFDQGLHTDYRYYLRTLLVAATPVLGVLAALFARRADADVAPKLKFLPLVLQSLSSADVVRAVTGAFLLVMLVHAVETTKFVAGWTKYKAAVAALAMGTASDPALGNPQFVSADRIGAELNRLSWFSTTPYLSVIVANFSPARLVVDPRADDYFWLSCSTATNNLDARRVVPLESRRLIRTYACLHRK